MTYVLKYLLKQFPNNYLKIPASFLFYFRLFKQTLQFLQQIYVKNVHPVYGAGIRTHDLWNMLLHQTRAPAQSVPLVTLLTKWFSFHRLLQTQETSQKYQLSPLMCILYFCALKRQTVMLHNPCFMVISRPQNAC